ncbi:MAG: ribose-5-phosphate isomerase RpiA [Anaerolineales bacterium]
MTSSQNDLKARAAKAAVDLVESGMVVGLGHGSTVEYAVDALANRVAEGTIKDIVAIACSLKTESLALQRGIPLVDLNDRPVIDLTIDGADEVDPALNLIKGGGGALMREKIVAQASRREVIIVDEIKVSHMLGTRQDVPIEVSPFGWKTQQAYIAQLGCQAKLREGAAGEPYQTDQSNFILDCSFGPIEDSKALAHQLEARAGILEHGLFIELATDVIVAGKKGLQHLKR